ncbi:hypothetical protein ACKC5O_20845, partial [Aeromonas schubertii]|uniref:hypothetical protein n=1 Tax=Aeromonas schubertii TaxID=652 RepID=UPI0038B550AD
YDIETTPLENVIRLYVANVGGSPNSSDVWVEESGGSLWAETDTTTLLGGEHEIVSLPVGDRSGGYTITIGTEDIER